MTIRTRLTVQGATRKGRWEDVRARTAARSSWRWRLGARSPRPVGHYRIFARSTNTMKDFIRANRIVCGDQIIWGD